MKQGPLEYRETSRDQQLFAHCRTPHYAGTSWRTTSLNGNKFNAAKLFVKRTLSAEFHVQNIMATYLNIFALKK